MTAITTWNVNGLRAILKKGGFDWIDKNEPGVLCLQEIKARYDQVSKKSLDSLAGYHSFWNQAERPGYSGVALFSGSVPDFVQRGMPDRKYYGEGRLLAAKFKDIYLLNVYFPNGKRDHGRLKYKLGFYSAVLKYCDRLHSQNENIIICGDFNTAHNEIDLRNPKQNEKTSGFLPEERAWLDKFLEHGFVDIFRERYPQKVQYTWWTYRYNARNNNVGWRLDYFFVSEELSEKIKDIKIQDDIFGSDHCPVTLYLDDDLF